MRFNTLVDWRSASLHRYHSKLARFEAYLRQLGLNIKAARVRRNLRPVDIEEKIGLIYRHYQEIEAGRVNATLRTLFQLARLFKVEVEELVRRE